MGGDTFTKVYDVSSYPGYKAFTKYNFVIDITEFAAWCDHSISEGSTSTRPFSTSYNAATGKYTLQMGTITGAHMWPRPSAGRLYLVYYG